MRNQLETYHGFCTRNGTRCHVLIGSTLAHARETMPAALFDLSETGFCAEIEHDVALGAAVSVQLPTVGWVDAQIRWIVNERCGAKFAEPLSPAALALITVSAKDAGTRPRVD